MKTILYLFFVLALVSCSTGTNEQLPKKVIITGKVLNPDPDIFKVSFSVNRIGIGKERLSSKLAKDGSFKVSFESYVPTDVYLIELNFLILTHPGDSIHVEFNGNKGSSVEIQKSIKFSGDNSTLNNEVALFQQLYYSCIFFTEQDKRQSVLKEYNEVQYKAFSDSIRGETSLLLKKFINENNPSDETKNWIETFLAADYYKGLIKYPILHQMVNHLNQRDLNLSTTYYDFMKDLFPIDNNSLICGSALTSFVNVYGIYVSEKIKNDNMIFFSSVDTIKKYPDKMDSLMFFGTIKYTNNPLLRQMALTELLNQQIDQSEMRMFKKYEQRIKSLITEPFLYKPLFKQYQQTLERLDNPKLASDVLIDKIHGTSLKSRIDSIVKINRDKVIYMDCWATWCGPCMVEMPNSKLLIDEYKTKNVAFVFICLDSEERNWKAVLSKYSLVGQHYFLSKEQSNDFRDIFGITGIPHYILFDRKGNIVKNRAESPLQIKDKIDKLLD